MRKFSAKVASKAELSGAFIFPAIIALPDAGISGPVDFLLDTGSARTIVGEDDLKRLGLDINTLPRSSTPISGWGGTTEACVISNSCIFMRDSEGNSENFETPDIISGKNPRDRMAKKGSARIRMVSIPSVIGRDFLKLHGLVVHIDVGKRDIFMYTP